jgi:hypothetical protein
MRQLRHILVAAAALLLFAASACSNETRPQAGAEKTNTEQASPESPGPEKAVGEENTEPITFVFFEPSNFGDSANIDNKWLPMKPGTRYTWEGSTQEGDERIPHRVVYTVTDLTKVVSGVRTLVSWDRDYSDGKLVESELIFHAQDKAGNVWHLGQLRETYDDEGELVGSRAWLEGLGGPKAGIFMQGDPRPGTPSYSMGYAPPPFKWDDRARVDKVGEKTCVRAGCYEDVLVIDEYEPDTPGAHQLKYHAPGVGVVRVGFRGADAEKETLELVKVETLDAAAMAEARAEAFEIEKRANLYSRTQPSEHTPAAG